MWIIHWFCFNKIWKDSWKKVLKKKYLKICWSNSQLARCWSFSYFNRSLRDTSYLTSNPPNLLPLFFRNWFLKHYSKVCIYYQYYNNLSQYSNDLEKFSFVINNLRFKAIFKIQIFKKENYFLLQNSFFP